MKPLTDKQTYWLKHVQAWQEQNCTGKVYAEANGIKLQYLYNWKSYFKTRDTAPTQTPVNFSKINIESERLSPIRITLANGVRIELAPSGHNDIVGLIQQISQLP